jgi:putative heme-binding domain-containing protein
LEAALLAASWDDANAKRVVRTIALNGDETVERRQAAIDALAASQDRELLQASKQLLAASDAVVASFLAALGRYEAASVAEITLAAYDDLAAELQPQVIDLLTQRTSWSKQLLAAISRGQVSASSLNVNHIRKLLGSRDKQLAALARQHWGQVRTERDPQREQLIRRIRQTLSTSTGDPHQGQKIFNRVCGQCHKIYGSGQDVGPEITRNGRGNFEQLLSNVLDPSLVIGAAYQARTVVTTEGRVLTGLLAEDNERRIVLKTQGGKQEIIPREKVDEVLISKLSLMPEGLEKQLPAKELVDLFAFLVLTLPPSDVAAEIVSGTPANLVGR